MFWRVVQFYEFMTNNTVGFSYNLDQRMCASAGKVIYM